jgi:hypothetical protein
MFSSYERMFVSLTLRIRLLMGQNMGTQYWNHALVGLSFRDRFARRYDLEAFNACVFLFQKALY